MSGSMGAPPVDSTGELTRAEIVAMSTCEKCGLVGTEGGLSALR